MYFSLYYFHFSLEESEDIAEQFYSGCLSELGCIVGADLLAVGAGKEGWLIDSPNLLVALDTNSIALANHSLILVLNWSQSNNGGPDLELNRSPKIIPELSPIEAEYISAVECLFFD